MACIRIEPVNEGSGYAMILEDEEGTIDVMHIDRESEAVEYALKEAAHLGRRCALEASSVAAELMAEKAMSWANAATDLVGPQADKLADPDVVGFWRLDQGLPLDGRRI